MVPPDWARGCRRAPLRRRRAHSRLFAQLTKCYILVTYIAIVASTPHFYKLHMRESRRLRTCRLHRRVRSFPRGPLPGKWRVAPQLTDGAARLVSTKARYTPTRLMILRVALVSRQYRERLQLCYDFGATGHSRASWRLAVMIRVPAEAFGWDGAICVSSASTVRASPETICTCPNMGQAKARRLVLTPIRRHPFRVAFTLGGEH